MDQSPVPIIDTDRQNLGTDAVSDNLFFEYLLFPSFPNNATADRPMPDQNSTHQSPSKPVEKFSRGMTYIRCFVFIRFDATNEEWLTSQENRHEIESSDFLNCVPSDGARLRVSVPI